jgi:hypothetical protein
MKWYVFYDAVTGRIKYMVDKKGANLSDRDQTYLEFDEKPNIDNKKVVNGALVDKGPAPVYQFPTGNLPAVGGSV